MDVEILLFETAPWVWLCLMFLVVFLSSKRLWRVSSVGAKIGYVVCVIVCVALAIWCFHYFSELYARYRLSLFDLDGDGIFTKNDALGEKQAFFSSYITRDTFRLYLPLGAFVQSVFILFFANTLYFFVRFFQKNKPM